MRFSLSRLLGCLLVLGLFQTVAFGQMQLVSSSSVLDVYLDIKKPSLGSQTVHYRVVNKTDDELKVTLTTWAETKFGKRLTGKQNTDFVLKPHADVSGGWASADVPGMEADIYFYGDKPNEMQKGDAIAHAYVQPSSINLTRQRQRQEKERRDTEAYNQQQRELKDNLARQEREQQSQHDATARQQQQSDAAAQAQAQRQQAAERQRAEQERQRREAKAASQQAAQEILGRAEGKDEIAQAVANYTVQSANRLQDPKERQQYLETMNRIDQQSQAQNESIQAASNAIQGFFEFLVKPQQSKKTTYNNTSSIQDAQSASKKKYLEIMQRGADLYQKKDYKNAFLSLSTANAIVNGKDTLSALYAAIAAHQAGMIKETKEYLQRYISSGGGDAEMFGTLAAIYRDDKEYHKAIPLLDKAFSLTNNSIYLEERDAIKQLQIAGPALNISQEVNVDPTIPNVMLWDSSTIAFAKSIYKIPKNSKVKILDKSGMLWRVSVDGYTGYVSSQALVKQ